MISTDLKKGEGGVPRRGAGSGIRRLAAWLAAGCLLLLLLEGVLRLAGYPTGEIVGLPELLPPNREDVPGFFEPGARVLSRIVPSLPYFFRINCHGFRGEEFSLEKPEGVFRILVAGDSVVFGLFVSDGETLPRRLEERLNGAASHSRFEAVNAGCGAFTISDELIFLRDRATSLRYDLVILVFSPNDIYELQYDPIILRRHALQPLFRLSHRTAIGEAALRLGVLLSRRRRGLSRAKGDGSLQTFWKRFGGRDGLILLSSNREEAEPLWETYGAHLAEAKALLDGRGVPLVLTYAPAYPQVVSETEERPQERLAEMAEELGIPFLDLTPALRERAGEGLFLTPRDYHFSPAGSRVCADAIAGFLREKGLLGGPAQTTAGQ